MKKLTSVLAFLALFSCSVSAQKYWVEGTTKDYYDNPVTKSFALTVNVNGDKATISDWNNYLKASGLTPVDTVSDKIEGTYDASKRRITISTPQMNYGDPTSKQFCFIGAANQYGNISYYILESCTYYSSYSYERHDELSFTLSADGTTITAEQNPIITQLGSYDGTFFYSTREFYTAFKMTKMPDGYSFTTDHESFDLTSQPMKPNQKATQSFKLINKGQADGHFTVTTSDPQLTVLNAKDSTLAGGQVCDVNFRFMPTEANDNFKGYIYVTDDAGNKISMEVKAKVEPGQPFNKVVDRGTILFSEPAYGKSFVVDSTTYSKYALVPEYQTNMSFSVNVNFTVPEGKLGTLSWLGECKGIDGSVQFRTDVWDDTHGGYTYYINKNVHPDSVVNDLSGNQVFGPGDYSLLLTASMWSLAEDHYMWLSNFALDLKDIKADDAQLNTKDIDFGTVYSGYYPVNLSAEANLTNLGSNALKVTGFSCDNPEFSGVVSDSAATILNQLPVQLTFKGKGAGDHKGNLTIHTTAGDFVAAVVAHLDTLETDFKPIVKAGDLHFNTSYQHPFLMETATETPFAFNSTHGQSAYGNEQSWLDVEFDVPQGQTGVLSFDAYNSSAKGYDWEKQDSVFADGTRIFIDDSLAAEYSGQCDASSSLLDPSLLKFGYGHHVVRFLYVKSSWEQKGDDMVKLSNLTLNVTIDKADSAWVDTEKVKFSKPTLLRTSTSTVTVRNLGSNPLSITSVDSPADGVFKATALSTTAQNLEDMKVKIVFTPADVKAYKDTIVIHTSAGDLKVACEGEADALYYGDHALEADKVQALLSDGFENGIGDDWQLVNDADGNGFALTSATDFAGTAYQDAEAVVSEEGDGYLVTRGIEIPAEGQAFLDFYSYGMDAKGVITCGSGDDLASFEPLYTDETAGEIWTNHTVDLTPYAGKTIKLAWKRDGGLFYLLDNVLVYHYDGILNGVNDLNGTNKMGQPSSIEYYSVNGARQNGLQQGVNIVKYRYADGTTVSRKVVRK